MRIVGSTGNDDIAVASIAEMRDGRFIEFVESVQPPLPRTKKWVLIVSTMFGCPVGCLMCDAGGHYGGRLTKDEILSQIDHLVDSRYPDRCVGAEKFKVQFARMGEPSLNPAVLDVLEELPDRYRAPGLMPSVSSVAPAGSERFFERLMDIKTDLYSGGRFQLQLSIHTTDRQLRDRLIPVRKWSLKKLSAYGQAFLEQGDRKITLNSALADGMPFDPDVLLRYFDPEKFLVKMTPVNPTYQARSSGLATYIQPLKEEKRYEIVTGLREAGFEVIVSVGEPEENLIGSNCGQYVTRHLRETSPVADGYTYEVRKH
jgi:23S rRNA (adenine2503-C2)-methyltransferase